jgi:hypothetical protein
VRDDQNSSVKQPKFYLRILLQVKLLLYDAEDFLVRYRTVPPAEMCHPSRMARAKISIPEVLPTSPLDLICPFCAAKPGSDCETTAGGLSAIHVARIGAAARAEAVRKIRTAGKK